MKGTVVGIGCPKLGDHSQPIYIKMLKITKKTLTFYHIT